MLTEVNIRNFRCFKHVGVPLRPLTVLIGQNDTGKSSFLRALHVLTPSGAGGLPNSDFWHFAQAPHLEAAVQGVTQRVVRGADGFQGPSDRIGPTLCLALPAEGPAMQCQGVPGTPQFGARGENVPAVVDYFLRRDRERFDSFVSTLKERIPGLEDVGVETPNAAQRHLELVVDGGFRVPADQTSAGVRMLLFFVALAHHPAPPRLLLVEEPENGLHPKRLAYIVQLLRGLTQGAFGSHEVQVVLTTHSPYLLDEVQLPTDQVLVFKRSEDGARTAEPVDADRLAAFLEDFKLGEVWFNQDESGLVKRP